MVTSFDKAIVALIMAVIQIIEITYGRDLGITEQWVTDLLLILSPILVWITPNMPEPVRKTPRGPP